MNVPGPTRITIELHPTPDGGTWSAITNVEEPRDTGVLASEPREELVTPTEYDPGDCTCLEDGGCGRDHANE